MRRLILVLTSIGVAVLLASGAALGITNPTPDNQVPYKYPYVGALVDGSGAYCSGTLVAGKDGAPVFVTAAHCEEPGQVYVTFDHEYVAEGRNFANPGVGVDEYSGTLKDDGKWYVKGHDIAVVDFDSGSTPPSTTLAQLPTLGQLADTAKGDKFTAVGYGATSGSSDDYGTRRYALSTFKSLNQTYLSTSQVRGGGGTCYGDSGGPNFIGTSNVIASTTITGDTWCKATNVTLRLDTVQAQNILAILGVKLGTQCFDGLDNDEDGKTDFVFGGTDGDAGCTSATDDSER